MRVLRFLIRGGLEASMSSYSKVISRLAVVAILANGCSHEPVGPSNSNRATVVIEQSPNPVRSGSAVTLTQHETAGVGVTAVREVIRFYDASGRLERTETYTGQDAWFSCGNPVRSVQHLTAGESCSFTYVATLAVPQYEYDLYVRDDQGNDLMFSTPRFVTTP